MLYQLSGFIDTEKIHVDACPALVADLFNNGDHGIIALAFGKLYSLSECFKMFVHMVVNFW